MKVGVISEQLLKLAGEVFEIDTRIGTGARCPAGTGRAVARARVGMISP